MGYLAAFLGGAALGVLLAPLVWAVVLSLVVPRLYRIFVRGPT